MRRTSKLMISAAACALPLAVLAVGSVRADTAPSISGLTQFHQMVIDTSVSPGYMFFSGGGSIVVTDLSGKNVTTLDSGDGVQGIALSANGSMLYAALTAGTNTTNVIGAITVSTITPTTTTTPTTYPLGSGDVPYSLAVQSGKVWVSYNTGAASTIGDINLTTSTFEPATAQSAWSSPPDLAADPSSTGTTLVAVQGGITPAMAATFNTTADPATALAPQASLGSLCSSENQVAVVPGGQQFVAACGSPVNVTVYNTANLSASSQLATGASTPAGVAIDAGGTVAVGTSGSPSAIYVYKSAAGPLLNVLTVSTSNKLAKAGLAWEDTPTGPQLAALEQAGTSGPYSVQVFHQPTVTASALTLRGPASIWVTRSATLSGTLAFGTGSVLVGTKITITRTVAGSKASKHFTVATAAGGAFKLTDTPPATGAYTYVAAYAGNSATAAATARHKVSVVLIPTSLTVTTSGATFTYEPSVRVTAHLGPTYRNRTVSIYGQWFGSRSRTLLKTGRVNSRGDLTVTYRAPHSTTFTVVFSGDAHYAAKTVARSVIVRAKVSESISGYYDSTHIGGRLYRLFHSTDLMTATASVAPDKRGECVRFEVWEYYQGAWHFNVHTSCVTLSRSSKAVAKFDFNLADLFTPYRIRADYFRSGNDTSNGNADSSWLYFEVEP